MFVLTSRFQTGQSTVITSCVSENNFLFSLVKKSTCVWMLYLQPQRNRAKIPTTPQKKTQKTCCLSISKKKHHPQKTRHQKIMLPPAFPPPKKKNPTQPTPTPFTHSHSHPPQKKQKMIPLFSSTPFGNHGFFLPWFEEPNSSGTINGTPNGWKELKRTLRASELCPHCPECSERRFPWGIFFGYGFFVKGLGKKNTRG